MRRMITEEDLSNIANSLKSIAVNIEDAVEAKKYYHQFGIYSFPTYNIYPQSLLAYNFFIGEFSSGSNENILSGTGVVIRVEYYMEPSISSSSYVSIQYDPEYHRWSFTANEKYKIICERERDRYNHCITLEDSTGNVLFTAMMRNTRDLNCASYSDLHTLFGGATYCGNGAYAKLDLRGGTLATDKLIKLDKTEISLEQLGAITYKDDVFLSK